MSRSLMDQISGSFREDAPRPPVPGEEGEAPSFPKSPKSVPLDSPGARRNDDGLGEPEGSASPDSPLSRWTKSLLSLLGDQDGALLFRTFLEREKCVDALDFWFACNGFRQMDLKDAKTQRVAKAIYKRYVESLSVVGNQLKTPTKSFIRDNIKRQHIDSSMFDQAQMEIQSDMEENAYQMFLTSEVYLDFVRTGGENLVCGCLPTLNEEEEWSCDFKVMDRGYRSYKRDAGSACHVGVLAPVSSTNDSEVSSDALTDDGSLDGVPPYKLGSKKQLQREMQHNMRMNSQVFLPAFPRTHCPPKEMVPMKPADFAAQLISRLENLKRNQEAGSSLDERLQQIQEEDEREEPDLSILTGSSDEDPQAILDQHLSRVLKSPGCQSPTVVRRSPELRPPSSFTKHIHHHYIHHHSGPKSKEQIEREAALRVHGVCPQRSRSLGREMCGVAESPMGRSSSLSRRPCRSGGSAADGCVEGGGLPSDTADPAQNVLQWIQESKRQGRHKSHSTQSTKKSFGVSSPQTHTWGGGGGHLRGHQPAQPFVQDPAMPPLPPPNTLSQLEEACRRLEEVSIKPAKPRHSCFQREKSHQGLGSAPLTAPLSEECKKSWGSGGETVVTYFFCGEEIPYRRSMKSHSLTLGHFKETLRKKGNYRFYFKKASDEFECGAVFEEVSDDASPLPTYDGKILGKVERME